jgi:hypothetical protein
MATLKEIDLLIRSKNVDDSSAFNSVDLDASTVFAFSWKSVDATNPAVTSRNGFSISIALPKTVTNDLLFDGIDIDNKIVDNFDPLLRTDFILYANGNVWMAGYLKLDSIDSSYNITLFQYGIDFWGVLSGSANLEGEMEYAKLKNLWAGDDDLTHTLTADLLYNFWKNNSQLGANSIDYAGGATTPLIEGGLLYIPSYQGKYDNFDSKSMVNYQNAQSIATETSDLVWEDLDSTKRYIANECTEHEASSSMYDTSISGVRICCGEYRSYYQKPALRLKVLYNKCLELAVNAGYQIYGSPEFFNANNPYWEKTWVVLPNISLTNAKGSSANRVLSQQSTPNFSGSTIDSIGETFDIYFPDAADGEELQPGVVYNVEARVQIKVGNYIDFSDNSMAYVEKDFPLYIYHNLFVFDSIGAYEILSLDNDLGGNPGIITMNGASSGNPSSWPLNAPLERKNETAWINNGMIFYSSLNGSGMQDSSNGTTFNLLLKGSYTMPANSPQPKFSVHLQIRGSTAWIIRHNGAANDYRASIPAWVQVLSGSYMNITSSADGVGKRSGATFTINDILRDETTAAEFVSCYNRIFGLHTVLDMRSKSVSILTRNEYFNGGVMDINDKIDRSTPVTKVLCPFDYNKGVFKWNTAGSKFEDDYLEKTGNEYGSMTFDVGTRFSNETRDFFDGMLFANTIIANDFSQYYKGRYNVSGVNQYMDNKELPHYQAKDGGNASINMSLVFIDGIQPVKNRTSVGGGAVSFLVSDDTPEMSNLGYVYNFSYKNNEAITTYPKVTRVFTDTDGNMYSLNFGRPSVAYNESEALVVDDNSKNGYETIYSRFWAAYLNDFFSRQRVDVVCNVLLSDDDILDSPLRKFYTFNNSLWVLSEINGYKVNGSGFTSCRFTKVTDITNYTQGQKL